MNGESGTVRARLSRRQRLGASEVAAALKSGRLLRGARFALYYHPNTAACARIALVVPKRLAPLAVTRNRIRRVVREAFRVQQYRIGPLDCVVRLTKPAGKTPVERAELDALFRRSVDE